MWSFLRIACPLAQAFFVSSVEYSFPIATEAKIKGYGVIRKEQSLPDLR